MARLRTIRLYEIAAWLPIVALAFAGRHAFDSENLALCLVAAAGVAVRLTIATESVRCDSEGVRWRTLFVTRRVGWDEITNIEVVAQPMKIRFLRGGARASVSTCMVIERGTGTPPLNVVPSLLVPLMRLGEFISAARLISPSEWTVPDSVDDGTGHRPSGRRVGRPIRPRDR